MEILSVTNGHKAQIQEISEGWEQIFLEAKNDCGSSEERLEVWVDCFDFKLSPNPASDFVKIEIDALKQQAGESMNYEITIFDNLHRQIKKIISRDVLSIIDTGSFLNGIYYVQITYNGKKYTKQLIIQH